MRSTQPINTINTANIVSETAGAARADSRAPRSGDDAFSSVFSDAKNSLASKRPSEAFSNKGAKSGKTDGLEFSGKGKERQKLGEHGTSTEDSLAQSWFFSAITQRISDAETQGQVQSESQADAVSQDTMVVSVLEGNYSTASLPSLSDGDIDLDGIIMDASTHTQDVPKSSGFSEAMESTVSDAADAEQNQKTSQNSKSEDSVGTDSRVSTSKETPMSDPVPSTAESTDGALTADSKVAESADSTVTVDSKIAESTDSSITVDSNSEPYGDALGDSGVQFHEPLAVEPGLIADSLQTGSAEVPAVSDAPLFSDSPHAVSSDSVFGQDTAADAEAAVMLAPEYALEHEPDSSGETVSTRFTDVGESVEFTPEPAVADNGAPPQIVAFAEPPSANAEASTAPEPDYAGHADTDLQFNADGANAVNANNNDEEAKVVTARTPQETGQDTNPVTYTPEPQALTEKAGDLTDTKPQNGSPGPLENANDPVSINYADLRTAESTSENPSGNAQSEGGSTRDEGDSNTAPSVATSVATASEDSAANTALGATAPLVDIAANKIAAPESVPVQQAPAQQAITTSELFDTMVEKIDLSQENGLNQMSIQLKPEFLGKVAVQLSITASGLQVRIEADDVSVRGLINSQIAQLTESLSDKGIRVSDVEVVYSGSPDYMSRDNSQPGRDTPHQGSSPQNGSYRGDAPDVENASYPDWLNALPSELSAGENSSVEYRA